MKLIKIVLLCSIVAVIGCQKPAEIDDFRVSSFEWSVDQRLFYASGDNLFCIDKNPDKAKNICSIPNQKKDSKIFVSPDSEYVVIIDGDTPKYVAIHSGSIPKVITNDSIMSSYRNGSQINNIQWDSFSQKICFITKTEHQDSCILQVYDIDKNEVTFKALIPEVYSFYFSKTGESIFYWDYYDYSKAIYYEISTVTGEILSQADELNDSKVFMNLFPSDLCNHTPDLKRRMIDGKSYDWRADLLPGTYLQSKDTMQLLIEGNWSGENFKGSTWSYHRTRKSYFLPGGRYYIFDVTSKQYDGGLLFDTKTKKYQKVENSIKYFYALNSNHFGTTINGELMYIKDSQTSKITVNDENFIIIDDLKLKN